jgi:hypothetical protein
MDASPLVQVPRSRGHWDRLFLTTREHFTVCYGTERKHALQRNAALAGPYSHSRCMQHNIVTAAMVPGAMNCYSSGQCCQSCSLHILFHCTSETTPLTVITQFIQ